MKNKVKTIIGKKRMLALAAALALGMSLAVPVTSYATQTGDTGVVDDEFADGEQETVAGPDAGTDTNSGTDNGDSTGNSNGTNSSGSGNGSSTGSSSGSGSSSSTGSSGSSSSSTSTAKSSDSSLAHLGISPGSISPAFSAGTHEYSATVDANVTAISVAARPNDSKAVIASVTGAKTLTPGTNTVKVVVSAENGTTTTYTITVICGSASDTGSTAPASEPDIGSESDTTNVVEGEVTNDSTDTGNTDQATGKKKKSKSDVIFDDNGYLIYEGESYMPSSMMPEGEYVSLDKYNKLYEQNQSQKSKYMRMVIILAVLLLVACIAILNLALKLRDFKQDAKLGLTDLDDEDDDRPVRHEKKQESKKVHKRSATTEAQTDMIPDLKMPQSMAEKPEKPAKTERPLKTEKTVKAEKPVKSYRTSHAAPDNDDLEILDLNDL